MFTCQRPCWGGPLKRCEADESALALHSRSCKHGNGALTKLAAVCLAPGHGSLAAGSMHTLAAQESVLDVSMSYSSTHGQLHFGFWHACCGTSLRCWQPVTSPCGCAGLCSGYPRSCQAGCAARAGGQQLTGAFPAHPPSRQGSPAVLRGSPGASSLAGRPTNSARVALRMVIPGLVWPGCLPPTPTARALAADEPEECSLLSCAALLAGGLWGPSADLQA